MRCWVVMGLTVVSLMGGAVHGKDFVIGQSLDLSGLSNLGKDFSNGVRTYIDATNARSCTLSIVFKTAFNGTFSAAKNVSTVRFTFGGATAASANALSRMRATMTDA